MIDKLEIRVPAQTAVGTELEAVYAALRRGMPVPGFKPSPYYRVVGDLRPLGIEAMAHFECRNRKSPNHKLELLETGRARFSELLSRAQRAFRFDPLSAEVMRVDLAADVEGVPVSWFENTAYAEYKRFTCDIGEIEYCRMGGRDVETLYLGKRPNCIRIYNKTAERLMQYRQLLRSMKRGDSLPDFQDLFGASPEAVVTRVERQIAAGRVPKQLGTVRLLRQHAVDFNPFQRLRLSAGNGRLPTVETVGYRLWLEGMGLRRMVETQGMHRTRRWLNRNAQRNAARILEQIADFLPRAANSAISEDGLFETYRQSVGRQLAA